MDLEITKVKSVRLYPTTDQKKILRKWFDVSRYSYNFCMALMRDFDGEKKPSWMDVKKNVTSFPEWAQDTPFQVKGIAIKDAHAAFWASLKTTKQTKQPPRFKFRSRKETTQSIYIPKSAIKQDAIYPRGLGKMKMRGNDIPKDPLDSRLVLSNGEFYLQVPYKQTISYSENQGRIVALDPGIRTFQTFFSENSCGSFGYDDYGRIVRLCSHLDDLISRTSKATGKKKYKMRQAQKKMRIKIKNLITEIHWQVANYLTNEFDVILLPTFESSKMSQKGKRKLRSKTVRAMLTWSHYSFKMKLKNKALERGKTVIDVCEAYTSKTCSWNGRIINVGGSRVIRSDGISLDRDLNGARNIFIRSLVDSPTLMSAIADKQLSNVY
jgi:putative transposase